MHICEKHTKLLSFTHKSCKTRKCHDLKAINTRRNIPDTHVPGRSVKYFNKQKYISNRRVNQLIQIYLSMMASTSKHQQLWHQWWKFFHGMDKWTLAQLLWLCFASQPYLSCWQCAVAGATSRGQREKCITRTRSAKPTADWAESAALLPSLHSQSGPEASLPPLGKVLPAKRWTSHLWPRAVHLIRESCAAAETGRKKTRVMKGGQKTDVVTQLK